MIAGAVVVIALIVTGVALALARDEQQQEEGTPERAVQLLLKAVQSENPQAAYALLSGELKKECSPLDFAAGNFPGYRRLEGTRITLDKRTEVDGGVIVTARVAEIHANVPFGTSEWSHRESYALALEDGEWRFTRAPWPLAGCWPGKVEVAPARPAATPTAAPAAPSATPAG